MYNYSSRCKRVDIIIIFLLLIFCINPQKMNIALALDEDLNQELSQNVEDILSDIDFSSLDNEVGVIPNLDLSFKDFVTMVLDGTYTSDYNLLLSNIKDIFLNNFKTNLRFFIGLFIIVVLFEIFKTFSDTKSKSMNTSLKIIFSMLLATTILFFIKELFTEISSLVDGLFSFAGVLFPILVGLLTLSGSAKSATIFSSFSAFLLETGSFVLKYILLPLSLSILLLSLFGSIFSKGQFSKLNNVFKTIFKYIIIIFFSVFGLLSTINVISSSAHDGINLKLTKFALKNYIPVLGGYVSEGFDFLFSCSVLVKNAIGVCSIVILIFKVLSPLLIIIFFSLCFKVLSAVTGFIGDGCFSQMFDDVSNSFGNFLSVILGSFLIVFVFVFLIILSVGVV